MRQYMDHMWKVSKMIGNQNTHCSTQSDLIRQQNRKPEADSYSEFSRGYEDYLQVPLQPLSDNLESNTYEVFEKDPIKYTEYKNAMEAAIRTKKAAGLASV